MGITELNMPRYKVVVQTIIGEVRGQGLRVASRCLWDVDTDNYTSLNWNNVRVVVIFDSFTVFVLLSASSNTTTIPHLPY
jgi:hypothetical protein